MCDRGPQATGAGGAWRHLADGRGIRGTSHRVSAEHCMDADVRPYDHLFLKEDPSDLPDGGDFANNLNSASLTTVTAKVEPSLGEAKPGDRFQFPRQGYYCIDLDSSPEKLVINLTVALRNS